MIRIAPTEPRKPAKPKATVTPVTVTQPKARNSVTVTPDDRIAQLEARVAKLEALIAATAAPTKSRAEYMREYRKRKAENE